MTEIADDGNIRRLQFAVSMTPDHEFLYGRLVEMGLVTEDQAIKIAKTGILINLGDGIRTRVVIKSDYDFDPRHDNRYTDNWDVFYSSTLKSSRIITQLRSQAGEIVAVGHQVLTPIAQELTSNPRLGENLGDFTFHKDSMS